MKDVLTKIVIVITLLIFMFGFSNSYSSHNIDNLAFVIALGIDSTETNNIKVSFQFTNNSSFSDNSSSSEGEIITESVEASSIDTAINIMNTYIGKQLSLAHCKAVVFSENIAKNGIGKEIYSLINNYQTRPTTNIIISKIDAKNYIKNSTSIFVALITKYYEVFPNSEKYTGYTSNVTIGYFSNSIYDSDYNAVAILGGSIISNSLDSSSSEGDFNITSNNSTIVGQREAENIGLAVFKKDTLVGELSAIEALCHSIITNQVSTFLVSVPDPKNPNNNLDLSASLTKKPKINVDVLGTSPYIKIDLNFDANVLTIDENTDYLDKKYIDSICESANKYMKSVLSSYLYKTSIELNSDIDLFAKSAAHSFLTTKDWESYNWEANYNHAFFDVKINTIIRSSLLLTES